MARTNHSSALIERHLKRFCHLINADEVFGTHTGLPSRCRLHGLKKGGMRRGAEAGMTTHELMAFSGHKTLTMVQHYTNDVDRKRLADSGMAKLRGQSKNANVTNTATSLHKHAANTLKTKG